MPNSHRARESEMEHPDYWYENQADAAEPDPVEITVNDVLAWADGIWDAQHNENADKITKLEAALAYAINKAHDEFKAPPGAGG